MRNRSGEKIKLSGIDELLGVVNEESAMEIDIASIHPFAGHTAIFLYCYPGLKKSRLSQAVQI